MTTMHEQGHATDVLVKDLSRRDRIKSYIGAVSGNFLEWLDWTMFAVFTPYIAMNFFDTTNPTSALLNTLVVFAVGFVSRPVGALVLGRMGDRIGRKMILVFCISMMSVCAFAIALIPTYAQIGIWASVLLVVVRLVQGFVHGGEAGAAYTYIAELAPKEKRAFWGSGAFVSANLGALLATLMAFILTSTLGAEAMGAHGWRIAFMVAGVVGVAVYFIRRAATETIDIPVKADTAAAAKSKAKPPAREWSKRAVTRRLILVGALVATSTMPYYIWGTLASTTAITTKGMDPQAAFAVAVVAQALILVVLPFSGKFVDRFGRRIGVIIYAIGVIVLPIPLSFVLSDQPWSLFVYMIAGLLFWTLIATVIPVYLPELLPTGVRAFGVSFGSAVAIAIFSGTAPYLQTWLASMGIGWVFALYMSLTGVAALVIIRFLPETKGIDLNDVTLPEDAKVNA